MAGSTGSSIASWNYPETSGARLPGVAHRRRPGIVRSHPRSVLLASRSVSSGEDGKAARETFVAREDRSAGQGAQPCALWAPSLAGRVAADSADRRGGLRSVVPFGVGSRRGQAHLRPHSGRDLSWSRGGRACPPGDRADVRGGVRRRYRRLPRLGRRGRGPAGRARRGPGHGRGRVSGSRRDWRQGGRHLGDDHTHNLPRTGHWPPARALSGGPDRGFHRPPDKRPAAGQP